MPTSLWPQRCDGDKLLSPIPAEIYVEIIEYLEPSTYGLSDRESKAIFCRLRQVSRWFSDYLTPRLFKSLHCAETEDGHWEYPTAFHFISILGSDSMSTDPRRPCALRVATYVTELILTRSSLDSVTSFDAPPLAYAHALGYLPNLRTVILYCVDLDDGLFNALGKLENLEDLSLTWCGMTASIPLDPAMFSKLRSLKIQGSRFPSYLFSPKSATLHCFETDSEDVAIPIFLPLSQAYQLVELKLPQININTHIMLDVLSRSPSIECLEWNPPDHFLQVPLTSLQHLEELHTSVCTAVHLLPGRPVTRLVVVDGGPDDCPGHDQLPAIISRSCLEELVIPTWHLPANCVTLRKLVLRDTPHDLLIEDLQTICASWAFHHIHEICFARVLSWLNLPGLTTWNDLVIQHDLIRSVVTEHFPQVQWCTFEPFVWHRQGNSEWSLILGHEARELVLYTLQNSSSVRDWRGSVAATLTPAQLDAPWRRNLLSDT